MASVPPRPASQRRSSPEHTAPTDPLIEASQSGQRSPSHARSAHSEDSQTLFLNSPPLDTTPQDQAPDNQQRSQETAQPAPNNNDDPNIRKCWICFADETEDTPETSPWRDPCPCALTAHEECLLDWIADMEAPKNSRNRSIAPPQILCPQCKSEIHLARPKDYAVEAFRAVERVGARLITPGALMVLGTAAYRSCMVHGMQSIYAVFGAEDGYRILRPIVRAWARPPLELNLDNMPPHVVQRILWEHIKDHLSHWRLYVGLPLITPMLVLSRTSLADSILPVLPILFFATQTHSHSDQSSLDFTWPPSASLAFAILPYIRSAYNAYYERFWAEKEKNWLKEIQPRNGQSQNDANDNDNNDDDDEDDVLNPDQIVEEGAEDDNVFEIRVDGDIWNGWDEDDDEERPPNLPNPDNAPRAQQQQAPPLARPPLADAEPAAPPPDIQDNRDAIEPQGAAADEPNMQNPIPQPRRQQAHLQGERRLSFSPTAIAETLLGALLFPTISSLSGEILKLALPKYLTTARVGLRGGGPKGLLQQKWGRSLVGGCLFVVCKDALVLYVRWKMAQMHRKRSVLDWDKKRGSVRT